MALNAEVIAQILPRLGLRTLTIDVDGTVVSTGLQVERVERGYNPHRRKVPSYYPIMAHLAETTHVLRVRNRSGNAHDCKASLRFLRELWQQLSAFSMPRHQIRFRMDGAFFREDVLRWLTWREVGYAIKVPFCRWLDLQQFIKNAPGWTRVTDEVSGFVVPSVATPWGRSLPGTQAMAARRGERAPAFIDPPGYSRHRPERTLLYEIVAQHYSAFREAREAEGRPSSRHVQEEFEAYLKCGRLEEGFLRVRCERCRAEKLVAFSRKKRGICPSCGARPMADTAALLVDEGLPRKPRRQWVLSVPYALGFLLATHPRALTDVLGIAYHTIAAHLISKAGFRRSEAQAGAVTLIQCFGSA